MVEPKLARAARGLQEALERWEPTRLSTDPDDMLIATTEVLWWAMALDEQLSKASPAYRQDLDGHRDAGSREKQRLPEVIKGLRHARNRLGHQLADGITVSHGGFSTPIVAPIVAYELRWVSLKEIDQNTDPRHPGKETGSAYAQVLAGQTVRSTIYQLREWLFSRPEIVN